VPDLLTSVRYGPTLLVAADYGGSHKESLYETLGFLVVDLAFIWLWDEFRQKIRKDYLGDGRKISFKDLRDRQRAKAIVPFLRASNTIPGLIIVFAIGKNLSNILSEPCPDRDTSVIELSCWNKTSFSKLSRISILGALLVACMSAPNQNILWFSDQDEIAPNESKIRDATKIVAHYISHLCPHPLKHLRFGTTSCDDGTFQIEDLAAIPDLAAGALSEIFSQMKKDRNTPASQILLPAPKTISEKSQMIAGWLADGPHPLRKMIVMVDKIGEREYKNSIVRFYIGEGIPEFDWTIDVNRFMQNKIIIKH
jgi:hypothetical protein